MVLTFALAAGAFVGSVAAVNTNTNVDVNPNTTNDVAQYIYTGDQNADANGTAQIEFDISDSSADVSGVGTADVSVLDAGTSVNVDNVNNTATGVLEIDIDTNDFLAGDTTQITVDNVVNDDTPGTYNATVDLQDSDANSTLNATGSGTFDIEPSLVVTDVRPLPSTSPHGLTFDYEIDIMNQGTSSADAEAELVYSGNGTDDAAADNVIDNAGIATITPGETTTFSGSFDTGTLNNASNTSVQEYELRGDATDTNTGETEDMALTNAQGHTLRLTVGLEQTGRLSANVQDGSGDDVDEANVRLYRAGQWTGDPATSPELRNVTLGANQSTVTFDDLALGDSGDPSSYVDYVLYAEKDEFDSDSTQEALHYPDNDGPTRTLTLLSAIEPNVFGVGAFDSSSERVTGNTTALFANGQFGTQDEIAVFAQTQASQDAALSGDDEVTVDLLASNRTGDAPLEFVTDQVNETTSQWISVTIDADSPVANVDGNSSTGEFSYETVSLSARNATQDNVDPLRTEDLFAWTTDIGSEEVNLATELERAGVANSGYVGSDHEPPVGQVTDTPVQGPVNHTAPLQNYGSDASDTPPAWNRSGETGDDRGFEALINDVFYFVEGDRATQHEVVDVSNNEMADNATVWAAYEGGPQDLATVETFQNAAGESFLVGDEVEGQEGKYVIPGLVQEAPFNLYVVKDGYNIFNSSDLEDAEINGQTLSQFTGLPVNTLVADFTVCEDERILEASSLGDSECQIDEQEGSGAAYDYTHHIRETALDFNLDVWVEDEDGEFVKHTEVPDGATREVRVNVTSAEVGEQLEMFTEHQGAEVELELVDTNGTLSPRFDPAQHVTGPGVGEFPDSEEVNQNTITVETNEDGVGFATFEAESGVSGFVNVSASTWNANNEEYSTTADDPRWYNNIGNQSEIRVITTGDITGDIVDEADDPNNIPGADVWLSIDVSDPGEPENWSVIRGPRVSGPQGSYTFLDVPTGESYRVDAEFTFEGDTFTGFNTVPDLTPGTTGGQDVVLQGIGVVDDPIDGDAEDAFFDEDGNPVDDGEVIQILLTWQDTGEVNGVPVDDGEMIQLLLTWQDARN